LAKVFTGAGTICAPWSTVAGEPFVPTVPQGVDSLDLVTKGIVGSWIGSAAAPTYWVLDSWQIAITFAADGYYEVRGYNGTATNGYTEVKPPPFYYGDQTDCPSFDRWRLNSIGDAGVSGQIDTPFYYVSCHCYLPAWQGELSSVALNSAGNRLHFSFATSDGYGPIEYDLWRVCPTISMR